MKAVQPLGPRIWPVVLGLALVGLVAATDAASPPTVSRVRAAQLAGTQQVEILYDLSDDDRGGLTVSLSVSDNGGATFAVPATSFATGSDVGPGVAPGTRKRIVWDAGKDWPNRFSANMRFRVTATDGDEPPNPDSARMVWIPAGEFLMGSSPTEVDREENEGPPTRVTLTKGFWLGRFEVTQREYLTVMGSNPSTYVSDPDLPVDGVSWMNASQYCLRLTAQERAAGRLSEAWEYQLPTEAQWEYACRAGTTTATAFGNRLSSLQANFDGRQPYQGAELGPSLGRMTKGGSYPANNWGVFDMHGNVWEWCRDRYADSLAGGSVSDPEGPDSGAFRVLRGGDWLSFGRHCRSAHRVPETPLIPFAGTGFRVARVENR